MFYINLLKSITRAQAKAKHTTLPPGGVWRTVKGHHIYIKDGKVLAGAGVGKTGKPVKLTKQHLNEHQARMNQQTATDYPTVRKRKTKKEPVRNESLPKAEHPTQEHEVLEIYHGTALPALSSIMKKGFKKNGTSKDFGNAVYFKSPYYDTHDQADHAKQAKELEDAYTQQGKALPFDPYNHIPVANTTKIVNGFASRAGNQDRLVIKAVVPKAHILDCTHGRPPELEECIQAYHKGLWNEENKRRLTLRILLDDNEAMHLPKSAIKKRYTERQQDIHKAMGRKVSVKDLSPYEVYAKRHNIGVIVDKLPSYDYEGWQIGVYDPALIQIVDHGKKVKPGTQGTLTLVKALLQQAGHGYTLLHHEMTDDGLVLHIGAYDDREPLSKGVNNMLYIDLEKSITRAQAKAKHPKLPDGGVWRTIKGHHVYIKNGKVLAGAGIGKTGKPIKLTKQHLDAHQAHVDKTTKKTPAKKAPVKKTAVPKTKPTDKKAPTKKTAVPKPKTPPKKSMDKMTDAELKTHVDSLFEAHTKAEGPYKYAQHLVNEKYKKLQHELMLEGRKINTMRKSKKKTALYVENANKKSDALLAHREELNELEGKHKPALDKLWAQYKESAEFQNNKPAKKTAVPNPKKAPAKAPTSDKYHMVMTNKETGKVSYQEVEGAKKADIDGKGREYFYHTEKRANGSTSHRISEAETGLLIAHGTNKKQAHTIAQELIDKHHEKINQKVKDHVTVHGASPYVKPIAKSLEGANDLRILNVNDLHIVNENRLEKSTLTGGAWKTVGGRHVYIKNGTIMTGALKGKKLDNLGSAKPNDKGANDDGSNKQRQASKTGRQQPTSVGEKATADKGRNNERPKSGGQDAGGNRANHSHIRHLAKKTVEARNDREYTFHQLEGKEGADAFHKAILASKAGNDHGAFVHAYEAHEYEGQKMFLTDGGEAGFTIKSNGDICSVFHNPKIGTKKGVLGHSMELALQHGGNRLDCFDGFLPKQYAKWGFEPVAKVQFNKEYAPEGWNFERDGEPDVLFFAHNGDSLGKVLETNYPQADLAKTPLIEDYDDGIVYQDAYLEGRKSPVAKSLGMHLEVVKSLSKGWSHGI